MLFVSTSKLNFEIQDCFMDISTVNLQLNFKNGTKYYETKIRIFCVVIPNKSLKNYKWQDS